MIYARAGFASLLFAFLLFAGWGGTVQGILGTSTGTVEISVGPTHPELPMLIASIIFLLFSALMFLLHHLSDNEGKRVQLPPTDSSKLGEQLRIIIEDSFTATTNELRKNENDLHSSAIVNLTADEVQLLIDRQTSLEEKLKTLYKGKTQIEHPSSELDSLLNKEGRALICYESAVEMIGVSDPLAISMFEELSKYENPKEIRTLLTLSDLYRRVYRHDEAQKCNDEALLIDPDNLIAKSRLAYYMMQDGDIEGCERLILAVIDEKIIRNEQVALDYCNYAGLLSDIRRPTESIIYCDKALKEIEAGDTSAARENIIANKAAALQNSDLFLPAQKLFFESYNALKQGAPDSWLLGRSQCEISRFYHTHGSDELASRYIYDSLSQYKKESAANYLAIEAPLTLIQEILFSQKNSAALEPILEDHIRHFRSLEGATNLVLQAGLWMFADLYNQIGRFNKAEPLFVESINLYENAGTPNKLNYGNMLANLGIHYRFKANDLENADKFLRSALAIRERFEGKYHEHTATTLKNLAGVLNEKGSENFHEANNLYLRALRIRILRFGFDDFTVAKWIRAFGWLDVHMRYFWRARIKFSYVLQIYQNLGCHPFLSPHVRSVVGEIGQIERLESGIEPWPWDT